MIPFRLEIQNLYYIGAREDMMVAAHALIEAEMTQQVTQLTKSDVGVG
jgi:hypothetical protein